MKQPVIPEIKPRKKYDRNFKQQAVTLWLSSGKSAPTVAAELGLRDKQLYEWKKTFVPAPGARLSEPQGFFMCERAPGLAKPCPGACNPGRSGPGREV